LNLKRKQEARETIFSAVDAGTRGEAREFFGFRAFLVNLRPGHKARSAKKIFPCFPCEPQARAQSAQRKKIFFLTLFL
jgi:hypothetical protein